MNNTCPKCGSKMIKTTGPNIRASYPPQYEIIMWCGCGVRESRGWQSGRTIEEVNMDEWKRLNSGVQWIECKHNTL